MEKIAQTIPMSKPMPSPDLGWTTGPLPSQDLEQIALRLFCRHYPMADWGDPVFSARRNECRRFTMELRDEFQRIDRWTLFDAAERLTEQSLRLCYGEHPIGPTLRAQVQDYCESFLEDLLALFLSKLFYPRDVEANQIEVERDTKGDVNG